MLDVAIVGAGPYGLSCAAGLRAGGVVHAIFGQPMQTWREAMPAGMHLKSEGFASNLTDPGRRLTLGAYSARHGLPYADVGLPVPLETFVAYGLDFQAAAVPHLDRRMVSSVRRTGEGFILQLDDGASVAARRVVMAVGISYFRHLPAELVGLPHDLVSHSGDHHDLSRFRGRSVTVIGAGASALDTAMLLHEAGARVGLVARRDVIDFHDKSAAERSLRQRLRAPRTEIGQGWRSVFYTRAPGLFRWLPEPLRLDRVARELGPAPGWFVRDRVANRFPFHLGCAVVGADPRADRVALTIVSRDGRKMELIQDHVIAGTGYRPDLDRIAPLSPELRAGIRRTGLAPLLSSQGESSVPGLYFVGPAAANSLGPMMRFACGTAWVAPRLARHLAGHGKAMQQFVPQEAGAPSHPGAMPWQ